MIRNYFITALRNLRKNKIHSFINVAGLSGGMAVALFIALWIWDEVSYNHDNPHHAGIGQVFQNTVTNNNVATWMTMPLPMAEEIRMHYGSDFRFVVMGSWNETHVLSNGTKQLAKNGTFFEPKAPELLNLHMLNAGWSMRFVNYYHYS